MQALDLPARLERDGLLLASDAKLPSVAALVAGEAISGSWWSHPRGKQIFAQLEALTEHPDILCVKLLDAKLTFVHRRLWPGLLSIARAREPWQMAKLSKAALVLLARADDAQELETKGAAVKELERRLLVHTRQVHTPGGAHALALTSWSRWARRHGPFGRAIPVARARQEFHELIAGLNAEYGAKTRLPF